MFRHVSRHEGERTLHISHLFKYVSAYHLTEETLKDLVDAIEWGVKEARKKGESVIVDQDGEMCFHVHPNGNITLMMPWKHYKIIR